MATDTVMDIMAVGRRGTRAMGAVTIIRRIMVMITGGTVDVISIITGGTKVAISPATITTMTAIGCAIGMPDISHRRRGATAGCISTVTMFSPPSRPA